MTALEPKIYSVLELNSELKREVEMLPGFRQILVRGEISQATKASSGHLYFTLNEPPDKSVLSCVMFRQYQQGAAGQLRPGMKVICAGSITVYEKGGKYQLKVEEVFPEGVGQLHLQAEELKRKLREEGLFDPARKRTLPTHPRRIGIVTSSTGAAVRDIVNVSRRRYPNIEILLSPTLVQGDWAPRSIVAALRDLYTQSGIDVIIIGRGGGSFEDLNAFNHEDVVRTIAVSPVPIVSAVGHETDFTISDLVADLRAPTPSAAAELVVPRKDELCRRVDALVHRAGVVVSRRVEEWRRHYARLARHRYLVNPELLVEGEMQKCDELDARLWRYGPTTVGERRPELTAIQYRLAMVIKSLVQGSRSDVRYQTRDLEKVIHQVALTARADYSRQVAMLDALSPLSTLARGYSVCQDAATGKVISNSRAVEVDQELLVRLHRGSLGVRVTDNGGEEQQ